MTRNLDCYSGQCPTSKRLAEQVLPPAVESTVYSFRGYLARFSTTLAELRTQFDTTTRAGREAAAIGAVHSNCLDVNIIHAAPYVAAELSQVLGTRPGIIALTTRFPTPAPAALEDLDPIGRHTIGVVSSPYSETPTGKVFIGFDLAGAQIKGRERKPVVWSAGCALGVVITHMNNEYAEFGADFREDYTLTSATF